MCTCHACAPATTGESNAVQRYWWSIKLALSGFVMNRVPETFEWPQIEVVQGDTSLGQLQYINVNLNLNSTNLSGLAACPAVRFPKRKRSRLAYFRRRRMCMTYSPVFSLRQRSVVVLVEVREGRLGGLEEREVFHAAENPDANLSAGPPLTLASAEHKVRPALQEGVVVFSGLASAILGDYSVPSVFLDHHPAPTNQIWVRRQEVPAAGAGRNRDGESGSGHLKGSVVRLEVHSA